MRTKRTSTVVALAVAGALLLGACGGSSSGGNTTGSSSSTGTYKLGLLYDATGAGAALGSGVQGIEAYIKYVNDQGGINGVKLSYVTADDQTTPAGALTAAQKLVQQDHVYAIISDSSVMFAAEPFLLKSGVPVIGTGFDGPEWGDPANTNMFGTQQYDFTKVYATAGTFFKSQGVTSCAALGFADIPSSTAAAKDNNASCKHAGLKAPLVELVKFGTTDTGPIALSIKNSGADGLATEVDPTTGFSVAAVLQELGVKMKSILFADGYGGDLLASAAGIKAAQGYDFSSGAQPVELNTPATQLFQKNLAAVGVTTVPTTAEYVTYQSVAAFMAGAEVVGPNASQADFIKALRAVKGFTAGGLLAAPIDFANYSPATQCLYVVKLEGKKFVPLSQKPYCGGVVGNAS